MSVGLYARSSAVSTKGKKGRKKRTRLNGSKLPWSIQRVLRRCEEGEKRQQAAQNTENLSPPSPLIAMGSTRSGKHQVGPPALRRRNALGSAGGRARVRRALKEVGRLGGKGRRESRQTQTTSLDNGSLRRR